MRERRAARRRDCVARAWELSGERAQQLQVVNLGEGGLFARCKTGGLLLEGERVALAVDLPDGPVLRLRGCVVEQVTEVFHDAAAIRFDPLDAATRCWLDAWLDAA